MSKDNEEQIKACLDCKWMKRSKFETLLTVRSTIELSRCTHLDSYNKTRVREEMQMYGKSTDPYNYCATERSMGSCGENGKNFEPKKKVHQLLLKLTDGKKYK